MRYITIVLTLLLCITMACNNSKKPQSNDATSAPSTTTEQTEAKKADSDAPAATDANDAAANDNATTPPRPKSPVESLKMQGEKLAEIFCKCSTRKDADNKKKCEEKVQNAYQTVLDKLKEEDQKAAFKGMYEKGVAACS